MNEERQRVILYGDSVILTGVQVSLSVASHLEIITLDQPSASLVQDLPALHPDAVIFDLGSLSPDFPLALLQQAGLVLIGIDPDTHQALVWSGRQAAADGAEDLIAMIRPKNETQIRRE